MEAGIEAHEAAGVSIRHSSVDVRVARQMLQAELAERWRISPRTLERWRCVGTGPAWLQLGGRVLYRLEDILAFENRQRRASGESVLE